MQVIIPTAGKGTRLRPHTHTRAKPLFHVAGKPVLAYILDELKKVKVSEVIFIVGYLGDQIEEYVKKNYNFKTRFIIQKELKGQAHAIKLAEEYIKEDVAIWFVDTISDANIKKLKKTKGDGVIYVKEHEDPERFGIVFPNKKGVVEKIIEKPKNPPSNLANIGLYYTKDYKLMFECINELIRRDVQLKGEFYLMDAFNIMIKRGTKFIAETVNVWEDCGKPETLLATNRYLLKNKKQKKRNGLNKSLIIEPVFIEEGVKVENSIIGPYVSVAKNAKIKNSIVKNSIIGKSSVVEDAQLKESLIAAFAKVKGAYKQLNVGEDSQIILGKDENNS
ncbi:NTP transferase domain-containing protein [Candidatus Woesearchaeota archaeon]|nr:NTP transferase domain-containing protein [Candidatus Woesearchaeota archaeon]